MACPHKKECSGCGLINRPYSEQLRIKSRKLQVAFESVGLLRAEKPKIHVAPIIKSQKEWSYRTSTKLVLSEDSFGVRKIGLFQRQTKTVADIPDCPVHHPVIQKVLKGLFGPLREDVPAPFYDHHSPEFQKGRLKYVVIRAGEPEKHLFVGIILIHTGVDRQALEKWSQSLNLQNICLYEAEVTPADGSLVIPHVIKYLGGEKDMSIKLASDLFRVKPSVFFQANGPMNDVLLATVTAGIKSSKPSDARYLLDLFGGYGAYSFYLADFFEHTWLVEAHPDSINAAQKHLSILGNSNVTPLALTVEKFLQTKFPWDKITDCIINPPRSGLGIGLATKLGKKLSHLKRLVYVSCYPDTLTKDLAILLKVLPLKITAIQPIDMFPQTEHLETVCVLESRS